MGADWPGEAGESSDGDPGRGGGRGSGGRVVPAETRSRQECYDDQHRTVSAAAQSVAAALGAEAWQAAMAASTW